MTMLLHHRPVLNTSGCFCAAGLIMPASRIGPTDIGYADNGIIQKKMASR